MPAYRTPQQWKNAIGQEAGGEGAQLKILIDIYFAIASLQGSGIGSNMIMINSSANQSTYFHPGLANWTDGLVIYGQMVLTPGQYTINAGLESITLNLPDPVVAGKVIYAINQ